MKLTDDQQLRVTPQGVDRDGEPVNLSSSVTMTSDQPLVSAEPDPDKAGDWIIRRLPDTGAPTGPITANIAVADATNNVSTTLVVEFDAGAETAISLTTSIEAATPLPAAAAAGAPSA